MTSIGPSVVSVIALILPGDIRRLQWVVLKRVAVVVVVDSSQDRTRSPHMGSPHSWHFAP